MTGATVVTDEGLEPARSLDESLAKILDTESLLTVLESDRQVPDEVRATINGLGLHGVALEAEDGGLDLGLSDRVRLAAVFGRRLLPAGIRDEVFGLAPVIAALARLESGSGSEPGNGTASVKLERVAEGDLRGGVVLDTALPGDDGEVGGQILTSLPEGTTELAVMRNNSILLYELADPAITAEPVRALDGGQGMNRITLGDAVPAGMLEGEPARRIRRGYELAMICEAFGAGERTLEVSVEYADQREQFGQAIASFQAVAHLLAEMKLGLETARAGVGRYVDLAGESDQSPEELEAWLNTLAHAVPAASRRACEGAIQVHGGIGFSWELGLHLQYRRILTIQYVLGGDGPSAERVGAGYLTKRRER